MKAAIEAREADIQRLHQELDPAEAERLDRKLAALGGGGDDDLRRLLEGQRVLRRDDRQALTLSDARYSAIRWP